MDQHAASLLAEDVTMECIGANGRVCQLDSVFSYDAADPYAVTVTFRAADAVVPWSFARDLLDRGMTDPAGQGDVHVWPSVDRSGRAVVVIELRSDEGEFIAQARTRDVLRFLQRSYSIVPVESEADLLDVDALVAQLLG